MLEGGGRGRTPPRFWPHPYCRPPRFSDLATLAVHNKVPLNPISEVLHKIIGVGLSFFIDQMSKFSRWKEMLECEGQSL